jgi:hypothetical protein
MITVSPSLSLSLSLSPSLPFRVYVCLASCLNVGANDVRVILEDGQLQLHERD